MPSINGNGCLVMTRDNIERIQSHLLTQPPDPFVVDELLPSIRQEPLLLLWVLLPQVRCDTST